MQNLLPLVGIGLTDLQNITALEILTYLGTKLNGKIETEPFAKEFILMRLPFGRKNQILVVST